MIYLYIKTTFYFFIRKSQQGDTGYNKQLRNNFCKKVFTGVFSLFFFFSVLGEPFAMNNGEDGSRQHPLRRNSLGQPYDSEGSGNGSGGDEPASAPHSEALFAAFLNAHGGNTLEDVSSNFSCPCFGPTKRCCNSVFGKSCCTVTTALSSMGSALGAGIGCCMELLSKSVIGKTLPTAITPTAITSTAITPTTTIAFQVPIGAAVYGLACCIICGSLGCICSYCTKQRDTLYMIENRMIRLRILSAIRNNIRAEEEPYVAFNVRSQSVTTEPRSVGFSDSTDNSVVTSQPSRRGTSDVGSSYVPGEHQRGEEGNPSEESDGGNGYEHIYETIGDNGALGGDEEPIYEEIGFYTTDLIPGYSYEGQVSSLLGMQCVLMDVSVQIPQKLRRLALKAYEKIPEMSSSLQDNKVSSPSVANYGQLSKVTKNFAKQNQNHIPCNVFAFTDNYKSNLEYKVRSSQAGIIAELCTGVHLGLTYSRHNDEKKEYIVMQLDEGRGSVKAKSEIESIAAVVTFNADHPGITGHFVSCYGWGKVKNKRFFTHAGSEISSSGSPAITITGGLVQVGYNLYVSKSFSVTPYVEGTLSIAKLEPYNEKRGILPCKLSESNESIFEKSIGLRSNWKFSENVDLQTWISGISGNQTSTNVSLQPLVASIKRYEVSVPMKNKNYLKVEYGLTYLLKVTESFSTGTTVLCSFSKTQKLYNQQISVYITYVF